VRKTICRQYKVGVHLGANIFGIRFRGFGPIEYHYEYYYGNNSPEDIRKRKDGATSIELIAVWNAVDKEMIRKTNAMAAAHSMFSGIGDSLYKNTKHSDLKTEWVTQSELPNWCNQRDILINRKSQRRTI